MGGDNATSCERQPLPIQKDEFKDKTSYVTVIFSVLSRSDMIDPNGGILEPEKVYDKVHFVHSRGWEEGKMKLWEVKDKKLKKQDKVIYIDCSYLKIDTSVCGFPGTDDMMKFLLHSIEIIKGYLDLTTAKGNKGKVHFNLCGYAPVEVLMYALRCILSHKEPKMKPYVEFSQKAVSKYGSTFKRYEDDGFSLTVDYCCIYEGYFVNVHQETIKSLTAKINEIGDYKAALNTHNTLGIKGVRSMPTKEKDPYTGREYEYDSPYYANILYHGKFHSRDDLELIQKELHKRRNNLINEKNELQKAYDDMSVAEQQYQNLQPQVLENLKLHQKNEALIKETKDAQEQLNRQINDPNSAEYQAYTQGYQLHLESDTLEDFHNWNQIEVNGQYVDLDVLESRIKRYEKELAESDSKTLKAENDAIHEIKMAPWRTAWKVVRIGIGIGTFVWGPLIFVDLAMEVFEMGWEHFMEDKEIGGQHFLSLAINAILIASTHGASKLKLGTSNISAAKKAEKALAKYDEGGEAALKELKDVTITDEATAKAHELYALESEIFQSGIPLEKIQKGKEFLDIRKKSDGLRNELSNIIYKSNKPKTMPILDYINDIKYFSKNVENLSASKTIWAMTFLAVDGAGNAYSIFGIGQNSIAVLDYVRKN